MTGRGESVPSRTTSAGGVIVGPGGCIAVVSQKGRSWSLPKGGVNEGEDLFAAALREVWEETGLTRLDLVATLVPYERSPRNSPNTVKRMVLYLFRTEETVLAPQDPDNPAAEWLAPREAAARLSHPRDREFLLAVIDEYRL